MVVAAWEKQFVVSMGGGRNVRRLAISPSSSGRHYGLSGRINRSDFGGKASRPGKVVSKKRSRRNQSHSARLKGSRRKGTDRSGFFFK